MPPLHRRRRHRAGGLSACDKLTGPLLALAILVLDQITKWLVLAPSIPIRR